MSLVFDSCTRPQGQPEITTAHAVWKYSTFDLNELQYMENLVGIMLHFSMKMVCYIEKNGFKLRLKQK